MGRPVIVDDGGSIRIKFDEGPYTNDKKARGQMDGLLVVDKGTSPKWASEEAVIKGHGQDPDYDYTKAVIGWVEESGASGTQPHNNFSTVLVSTDLCLKVELKRSGKKLKIRVFSDGDEPIIQSKSKNRKRDYVVLNGGNITQIECDGTSPNLGPTVYMGVTIT